MSDPINTLSNPLDEAAAAPAAEPARPPVAEAHTVKAVAITPSNLPEMVDGQRRFSISFVNEDHKPTSLPCREEVYAQVTDGRLDCDKRSDFLLTVEGGLVVDVTRMEKASTVPVFTRVPDGMDPDRAIDSSLVVVKVGADSRVSVASQPSRLAPATLDAIVRAVRTGADTLRAGSRIEGGGLVSEIRSLAGNQRMILVKPPAV